MAHVRLQIRNAIRTAITGLTTSGTNVFTNIVYDVDRLTLPALLLDVAGETTQFAEHTSPRKRIFQRDCDFEISACAEDNTDCDGALIGMAQEIEVALAGATGPWKTLTLLGSVPQLDAAQKVRGKLTLRYRATYFAREDAPDVAL